jgi:glutamine amidotransferase
MKIGIININSGNLFSLSKILRDLECHYHLCNAAKDAREMDKLIIPGVGSFYEAMKYLNLKGYTDEIKEAVLVRNIDILGICLGMQILFEEGEEGSNIEGLGLLKGKALDLKKEIKIENLPHIGWNSIKILKRENFFLNITDNTDFYFAHNYAVYPKDESIISSITHYEKDIVSSVNYKNIYGVQFHPEKSSLAGIQIIRNFIN